MTSPRIAILSTIQGYPWGAPDDFWFDAAATLVDHGASVTALLADATITSARDRLEALRARGDFHCTHIRLDAGFRGHRDRLRRALRAWESTPPDVVAELHRLQPAEILISQGDLLDGCCYERLYDYLAEAAVPFTVVGHNLASDRVLSEAHRALLGRTFRAARRVCVVSEQMASTLERLLLDSLPNLELAQYPIRDVFLRGFPWPADDRDTHLAFVARLDAAQKGHDLLFEALSRLDPSADNLKVHLFGEGPDRPVLEALSAHYGLQRHVVFEGVTRDPARIWNQCHAMILPSRFEGCSVAMQEAVLAGRPVIATDVSGTCEWVIDGETGFVGPSHSVTGLMDLLGRALDRRRDWSRMGQAARSQGLTRYHERIARNWYRHDTGASQAARSKPSLSLAAT